MIQSQKKLERKFAALEQVCDQRMERLVGQQSKHIQAEARLLCPVRHGELRNNIKSMTENMGGRVTGTIYTNKTYAMYAETGADPRGATSRSGISPAANPAYTMSPWWMYGSQVDKEAAEKHHWFCLDAPYGRFYQCIDQPTRPFMYPTLKDNGDKVVERLENTLRRELRKACK